jgi:hypothetical protein
MIASHTMYPCYAQMSRQTRASGPWGVEATGALWPGNHDAGIRQQLMMDCAIKGMKWNMKSVVLLLMYVVRKRKMGRNVPCVFSANFLKIGTIRGRKAYSDPGLEGRLSTNHTPQFACIRILSSFLNRPHCSDATVNS